MMMKGSLVHRPPWSLNAASSERTDTREQKASSFRKGRAWIEMDMESLRHNARVFQSLLPSGSQLMPAVKANAYGHGAGSVCRELNAMGVRAFCVASVQEGMELRKQCIKGEILVLGYTHPELFGLLRRYRLTQTVVDYAYAKTLNRYRKKLTVHIKIDTGMRRLGEPAEHLGNILRMMKFENLRVTGIYTHFSALDEGFTKEQADRFLRVLSKIKEQGFSQIKAHVQGSYGAFARPDLTLDYARIGIALFGAYQIQADQSTSTLAAKAGQLRPVLSVKARISAVKEVFPGDEIGYGPAFVATRPMRLAIISIGYSDGIPRALSNGAGHVLIRGYAAPTVGHICMDQMTVDVSHIGNVRQGDIAVVIGRSGRMEISAIQMAKQAGTVPPEILSRLGGRLERVTAE